MKYRECSFDTGLSNRMVRRTTSKALQGSDEYLISIDLDSALASQTKRLEVGL